MEWTDDVIRGADWTIKFMSYIKRERSQTYGMILHLMLTQGLKEIEMPSIEELNKLGDIYYILFNPDEDGVWKVRLVEREDHDTEDTVLD